MTEKLGVMLCGHGSRDLGAVAEFAKLCTHLKKQLHPLPVEYGYLEFAQPIIRQGLDRLRAEGVTRVLAVPGMLFAAGHAKNDIPSVLNSYAASHGLRIDYGKELGIDPKMIRAAGDRIREALALHPSPLSLHDTLLVVVGRGASDPDANSNVAKITRILWEGFGFGWAETAYSGVTFPLVAPALEHATRLGYKRIIIFPYFLFTGILIDRIYAAVDEVAEKFPHLQFIKAPYLNDHPAVIETFVERTHQILAGDTAMNCQMCKYRTQVLGFGAEVGAVQESHHHHVEGIGSELPPTPMPLVPIETGPYQLVNSPLAGATKSHQHSQSPQHHHHDHSHSHSHDHGDGHPHTHAPYPHADHPLGPLSMVPKG